MMPQPWVLSLPLFVFRILMLLWALWLAYSLLKWLRWCWQCFTEGGIWKKKTIGQTKQESPSPPPLNEQEVQ
jgi:membrane protein YdbS with pleckstrin-like domain